jgi:hypothetical protein
MTLCWARSGRFDGGSCFSALLRAPRAWLGLLLHLLGLHLQLLPLEPERVTDVRPLLVLRRALNPEEEFEDLTDGLVLVEWPGTGG